MLDKCEIVCLIGTNTLAYITIADGKFKRKNDNESSGPEVFILDMKERVLNLVNDEDHAFGMILLTDDGDKNKDYDK